MIVAFFLAALSSISLASQDTTPVRLDPLSSQKAVSDGRSWRAPDFSEQESALGWTSEAFETPQGMEKRVQFWIDIYTRYTTQQGVVHDPENIDLVYEVVDFSSVEESGLPASTRDKLKRKMVEDAKDKAISTLKKLSGLKSVKGLPESDQRIWERFASDSDPEKFQKAMDPSRLRFQLGQKDRMQSAIFLSGRYLEDFEKIFKEEGLPIELTRLVFVESSFNVLARSKVGASGLWQIMRGTAQPFRVISPAVDGRNHPITATKIAAKTLAYNFRMLGSWPLAVTGYNHGPAGVRRIVERYETKNLPELIENVRSRASFGFASRNFYASFLAAHHVEKNAARYFPGIQWSKKFDADEIKLPRSVTNAQLLGWFGGNRTSLQLYNPHLTPHAKLRGIPQGTVVSVPSENYSKVLAALGRSARTVASRPVDRVSRGAVASEASRGRTVHRVVRGESLTTIARSYGVSLSALLRENDMNLKQTIIPGQRLRIPH
ncbi:MAG: transglycosylase SLT domain-containing protein [Bdellovibrionaceae bacterium]|nr:transglycosylase SLT domain-containing protein [Pseudobdellovibrionaceae bacterium]